MPNILSPLPFYCPSLESMELRVAFQFNVAQLNRSCSNDFTNTKSES